VLPIVVVLVVATHLGVSRGWWGPGGLTYSYHSRTGRPIDADTDLSAADPVIVDGASWTASGQPDAYVLGSDTGEIVHRSWTYKDGSQRLARIRVGNGAGGDGISDFRHFYDAVGNVVKLNDENHGAGGQLQCFSYDDLNRLEGAFTSNDCDSGHNPATGTGVYEFWFDYSPIGSVMKLRDTEGGSVLADWDYGDTGVGAGAYAVHDWNPDPGGAVAIGYDESGNMISKGADSLVWDADNRLHSYDASTGTDTGFVYDADGNRILRIHGATTTTYIGDLYESDGSTTRSYYTFAGDTVGYREHTSISDDRFYLTGDHLGSTATVIDATDVGNPVDQYYYPYGEPRTSWSISTDRGYTGQTSDHDETGLYHYNARYYDPEIHRFISADTIIPDPANPQTLNRYSYVVNNPVNYSDPSGHRWWREGGGGGAVILYKLGEGTRKVVEVCGESCSRVLDYLKNKITEGHEALSRTSVAATQRITDNPWIKIEYGGTRVYQRNDLIDPALIDASGRTNLERMSGGLAPIGPDGFPLNLHHALQTETGSIIEVTQTLHQYYSSILHINPNSIPSGINRSQFATWRRGYWQNRALDFLGD